MSKTTEHHMEHDSYGEYGVYRAAKLIDLYPDPRPEGIIWIQWCSVDFIQKKLEKYK